MFKSDKGLFDDLAKMATGAVGAFSGLRQQIQSEIRGQMNRFISEMDFVPREDFEIVSAMAREARLQNQKTEARLKALEEKIGMKAKPAKADKTVKAKTAPAKKATSAARKKKA